MRIVAVSMVKNESDLLEAFCRHTAAVVDHHLIFDHQSSDESPFLLRRLAREGVPLTVVTDDRTEYLQAQRTTELMRRAVRDHGAHWVIPLDVDEFLQPGPPTSLRERMKARLPDGVPLWMPMRDYAPNPADDATESNPVLRLRHLTIPDVVFGKVAVPRVLAADPDLCFVPGNHDVHRHGAIVPADRRGEIWLAHFPVRSAAQAVMKLTLGELQRLASGSQGGGGTHYRKHFQRLKNYPRTYLNDAGAYLRGERLEPAEYFGRPLTLPTVLDDWERLAAGMMPFVERLAVGHGNWLDSRREAVPGLWKRVKIRLSNYRGRRSPRPVGIEFRDSPELPDSRTADALGCRIELREVRAIGAVLHVKVTVKNTGLCVWRHEVPGGIGTVNLGVQLWDEAGGQRLDRDYQRVPLPADVEPGEEVELACGLSVPPGVGTVFRLDLVSEGVAWFESNPCVVKPTAELLPAAA